jgi:TetR/AcrR family transcriptional regulator, transcriptional repressor of bet genes
MSSALAHHYFGSKEQIFLAAMRHILTLYGAEVRGALAAADEPQDRLRAVVRASFGSGSFRREVASAWLNFYVLAQTLPEAKRLLAIYQRRLQSNLVHDLRAVVGDRADAVAQTIGALIDGVYVREVLKGGAPDGAAAARLVLDCLQNEIGGA